MTPGWSSDGEDSGPRSAADTLAPLLGPRYQLDGALGEGGMSQVVRVFDRARGEPLALKVLHPDGHTAALGAEFQYIASLNHPGVVAVHDFGLLSDGRPFFTMELAEGGSLLAHARRVALPVAIQALREVFSTLEFVHARGIVHADLKSSNILMCRSSQRQPVPKLLDFGIAWDTRAGRGQWGGTVFHLAPEIIAGDPTDHRADLYAMGVVLYRLLTGSYPFDADYDSELMQQHLAEAPPDPRDIIPSAPPALAELALRLLAKQPDDRVERAGQAAALLHDWLRGHSRPEAPSSGQLPARLAGGARFVDRDSVLLKLLLQAGGLASRASSSPRRARATVAEGEPGIGKTRLLQELHVQAQLAGVSCLRAQFGTSRDANPIEHLARLVAAAAGAPAPSQPVAPGPDASLHQGQRSDSSPPLLDVVPLAEHLIVRAEAVAAEYVGLASRRPLVLCLDRLEAVPESAIAAMRAFIDQVMAGGIMVVGCSRPAADALRTELGSLPGLRRIALRQLERAETEQVVRSLLGEIADAEPLVEHVHTQSGGNPAAVRRIVQELVACDALVTRHGAWTPSAHLGGRFPEMSPDQGMRELARQAVMQLSDSQRQVATTAACLGHEFDEALLWEVEGPGECADRPQLLQGLVASRIVGHSVDVGEPARGGRRYAFRDPATRDELLRSLKPDGARSVSERVVDKLASRRNRSPSDRVLLAKHLVTCARPAEAAEEAAFALQTPTAPDLRAEAREIIRGALAAGVTSSRWSPSRWTTLACSLAHEERRQGELAAACAWYERVLDTAAVDETNGSRAAEDRADAGAESDAIRRTHATACRELGETLLERGDGRGDSYLAQALDLARALGDDLLVGRAAYAQANRAMIAGRYDDAAVGISDALAAAERAGDEALRAGTLKLRANLGWYRGTLDQAEEDARAAAALYGPLGDHAGAAAALGTLGNVLFRVDQGERAQEAFEEGIHHARKAGWLTGVAKLENSLSRIALDHRDDWEAARDHFRSALAIAERTRSRVEQALLRNNIAWVSMHQGDTDTAKELYDEALDLARHAGLAHCEAVVLGNLGELHTLCGRLAEARQSLLDARRIAQSVGAVDQELECQRRLLELDLAEAPAARRPIADIVAAARTLLERANEAGSAAEARHLYRVAAQALAAQSATEDRLQATAAEMLTEAWRCFEEHGPRYETARIVRLAAELAAGGMQSMAPLARKLEDARRLLRKLGAHPELERIRRLETAGADSAEPLSWQRLRSSRCPGQADRTRPRRRAPSPTAPTIDARPSRPDDPAAAPHATQRSAGPPSPPKSSEES